jgi:cell division transport system permease protein
MLDFLRDLLAPNRPRLMIKADNAYSIKTPLVPANSVAGRSLVMVIAIMTFLAALTAGAATLIAEASKDWRGEAASEASIQLRPTQGRDIEADLETAADIAAKTRGVASVKIYSKAESEGLLTPWLGQGLDLQELPVPRMIVLKLDTKEPPDLSKLGVEIVSAVPGASLDDHHIFISRLGDMARAATMIALFIFILVLIALGIAVASATRAAVATNREIVEVLHLVGATDSFIAREFRRRFFSLGLSGAILGGGGAIIFFAGVKLLSNSWRATAGGDQTEALFGDFTLSLTGYSVVLLLIACVAVLTGYLSQQIVFRHLQKLNE